MVYTGQFDEGSAAAGLIHIDPGLVEATEIVHDRHHELQGIVGFQVETLETLDGIRGRVGLGKGVSGKTFNLTPHFVCQRFRIPPEVAVLMEFFHDPLKFSL